MNDESPGTRAAKDPGPELTDPPADKKDGDRYAVYDRLLARFVGGVTSDKPTKEETIARGGKHAVVVVV